jgi:hypothetical protein
VKLHWRRERDRRSETRPPRSSVSVVLSARDVENFNPATLITFDVGVTTGRVRATRPVGVGTFEAIRVTPVRLMRLWR